MLFSPKSLVLLLSLSQKKRTQMWTLHCLSLNSDVFMRLYDLLRRNPPIQIILYQGTFLFYQTIISYLFESPVMIEAPCDGECAQM